ncbi:MAG: sensor histidine kinase [Muribaculaceae bacterium]
MWGLAIVGYYCWFQAFYNAVRFGDMFPYTDFADFIVGVAYNFTPIFFISLINLYIVFRLDSFKDVRKKICVDIFVSILAYIAVNCVYATVMYMIGLIPEFDLKVVDWAGALLNNVIILLCVELVYYFTRMLRLRKQADEANRQLILYQYDALKAQVNPHFLFNSLNILNSLVSIDTAKSKLFIRELAKIYRYIMAQQNRETVSLHEELDFLAAYVYVLKIRYNNQFDVIVTGEAATNKYVVPYTLQLLIENVTKHNVISSQSPMKVSVTVGEDTVIVSNPVHPCVADSSGRIGLQYLSKLYAKYGYQFRTESDQNRYTAFIPLITSDKNDEIRNNRK